MIIKSHEDLASFLGAYNSSEESISRAVYKSTECGAWAKLRNDLWQGRTECQQWKIDIRRGIIGFAVVKARRAKGRKWYAPKDSKWPHELTEFLSSTELGPSGRILDESTVQFLKSEVRWNSNKPIGRRYFDAEISVRIGKQVSGVEFGSIVEGIDATTDIYTVLYPCDSTEVDKAIQAIEDEARELWDNTHGCSKCWDGAGGRGINGIRPVDPDCSYCHGQGTVI